MMNDSCKIGDLGLYKFKGEDNVDEIGERIGAFGWESPETMNKSLTEAKENNKYKFDCEIDFKSDIFQLGKLFWYIFQGNLPIGQLRLNDFLEGDNELFDVLIQMLSYDKTKRPNVNDLELILRPIYSKYNVF
jgi:serine/threonine protein kinase